MAILIIKKYVGLQKNSSNSTHTQVYLSGLIKEIKERERSRLEKVIEDRFYPHMENQQL